MTQKEFIENEIEELRNEIAVLAVMNDEEAIQILFGNGKEESIRIRQEVITYYKRKLKKLRKVNG